VQAEWRSVSPCPNAFLLTRSIRIWTTLNTPGGKLSSSASSTIMVWQMGSERENCQIYQIELASTHFRAIVQARYGVAIPCDA
jgi:hypothetical protein